MSNVSSAHHFLRLVLKLESTNFHVVVPIIVTYGQDVDIVVAQ